jgi:hypothetical protein
MRMVSRTILVAAAAAVIAGSVAAAANADMQMTVGAPTLGGKVLITVPLTITCSPFDPSLTPISSSAFVSVEQASGRSIRRNARGRPAHSVAVHRARRLPPASG